jgi:hypothetical protein
MIDFKTAPYAALILRVSTGFMLLAHGLLKVFVFTIPGTVGFFESLGFPGRTCLHRHSYGTSGRAGIDPWGCSTFCSACLSAGPSGGRLGAQRQWLAVLE